jgi:hypothetical protein
MVRSAQHDHDTAYLLAANEIKVDGKEMGDEFVLSKENFSKIEMPNKDGFELHLLNLITSAYGTELATTGIKVNFPNIDEKEICMVEIQPGNKPIYTEITDKNGGKLKKFFVRRGNSSHELLLTEVSDYISARF